MRTLEQILKQAESTTELQGVIDLWNEIVENKYKYPLNEIHLAREKIMSYALTTNGTDIAKSMFYYELWSQGGEVFLKMKI